MTIIGTNYGVNQVGLRALRAHLSDYVEDVKEGRSYVLTEHGKPVARLVPLAGQSSYERLVAEGVIQRAQRRPREVAAPVRASGGLVSDLVGEQRR